MISYRKTGDEWAVCGPVTEVKIGEVTVTKKDGSTKKAKVISLGKPFMRENVLCVYGYLEQKGNKHG